MARRGNGSNWAKAAETPFFKGNGERDDAGVLGIDPNGKAAYRKKLGLLHPWRQVVRHPPLRRIRFQDVAKTVEPLAQIVFLLARILALQLQVWRTNDHSMVPESDGYGLRQMLIQYWMNEPRFQVHNSLQKNKGYSMTGQLDAIVAELASFPTQRRGSR